MVSMNLCRLKIDKKMTPGSIGDWHSTNANICYSSFDFYAYEETKVLPV